jgi:hypothetical protein
MSKTAPAFSPRQSAAIAGAAYLITSATAFWNLYVATTLTVRGDFARTAANIAANAQQFRVVILFELVSVFGCVVLNVALYELLAPVHRSLARLAAFWRLAESGVYGAITVHAVVVLSLLTADYATAFPPSQLHALVRAFRTAQSSGFSIAMIFLSLGSTVYVYLLFKSRYVPRAVSLLGLVMGPLGAAFFLCRIVQPVWVEAVAGVFRALPAAALAVVAMIMSPFVLFEVILGSWLLVKGVRTPQLMEESA